MGDEEYPAYVRAMLGYIYDVDIWEDLLGYDLASCIELFILGDRYDVPDLRNYICSILKDDWALAEDYLGTEEFRKIMGSAFLFPPADKRVQKYLVEMCAPFGVSLSKDKAFMEIVRESPELGAMLLETMFEKVNRVEAVFHCSTCKRSCTTLRATGLYAPLDYKAGCDHNSAWKPVSVLHTLARNT